MRKIIISLSVVAAVAAAVVVGTTAFFSDTETSTGNTISAGTLSISADKPGDSLFSTPAHLEDLKPSYVRFIEFDVKNDGNNPARVWKRLSNFVPDENGVNEPEQQWYDEHNSQQPKNDIDTAIEYDMYLGGQVVWDDPANTTGHVVGGSVVIDGKDGITMSDMKDLYMYLGEFAPQETKHVIQSYHMASNTENWAQSDTLTFDIELLALQLNAPGPVNTTLLLENKDSQWNRITGDGMYGVLTYKTENDTFDFTLKARGLEPNRNYTLIYYRDCPVSEGCQADGWPGKGSVAVGSFVTDNSGNEDVIGNPDLATDLPKAGDKNAPGAKFWVVLSSDWGGNHMIGWNPTKILYEYNLVRYDDTNN